MDQFAGEEDNLYEILKQNPEVGSFLYADGSGRMRVIHHLSPVIHGKSLVVGVEGFGASGEVKVVNCELFVAEIELEEEAGGVEVPPLLDFVKFDLDDVKPPKTNPRNEAREVLTMSQILDGQPKAYFLHPRWLELVHKFIHKKPSSIAQEIISKARQELNQGDDYEGEDLLDLLDESYALLVYLWACQNRWVAIDGSPITYTLESSNFEVIQNSILEKALHLSPPQEAHAQQKRFLHETMRDAPAPSFGIPPPIRQRDTEGDRSHSSCESDHRRSRSHRSSRSRLSQSGERRKEEPRRHKSSRSRSRSRSSYRGRSASRGKRTDRSRSRSLGRPSPHRSRARQEVKGGSIYSCSL